MSESVKLITLIDLMFVIMLVISGSLASPLGDVLYYFSFIIPIAIGFYSSFGLRRKREEIAGVAEPPEVLFNLTRDDARALLPLVAPSVAVIFLISLVTSLLLSLAGVSSPAVEDTEIFTMLLVHAAVPALFEEALFRYIPIKLLAPYSKRVCVFYSALCFALIHCSFSQMPYAFAAGMIFMIIDLAFESIWPSVILHFINNAASVIWIKYCSGGAVPLIFIGILFGLTLLSLIFILKGKKRYLELVKAATVKGERIGVTYAPAALILLCCYIAAANIFT